MVSDDLLGDVVIELVELHLPDHLVPLMPLLSGVNRVIQLTRRALMKQLFKSRLSLSLPQPVASGAPSVDSPIGRCHPNARRSSSSERSMFRQTISHSSKIAGSATE